MGHEVEELEDGEDYGKHSEDGVVAPRRCGILWMDDEVHGCPSVENPVVDGILEDVEQWHGVVGELVDEKSLEFTLDVVTKAHADKKLLVEAEVWVFSVDLLAEEDEKKCNEDGSTILDKEDSGPRHLRAQIFEDKSHFWLLNVVAQLLGLVAEGHSWFLSLDFKSDSVDIQFLVGLFEELLSEVIDQVSSIGSKLADLSTLSINDVDVD